MDAYFHFSWVNILYMELLGHRISVCLTIKTFSNCFPNWLDHFPRTAATYVFFSFVLCGWCQFARVLASVWFCVLVSLWGSPLALHVGPTMLSIFPPALSRVCIFFC